jgi:hypothetical protein
MIKKRGGDWKIMRDEFDLAPDDELDLHFGRRDGWVPYENVMADVGDLVEQKLKSAQKNGRPYLLITHGWSTSGFGKTTARSVVRQFMRSKDATPLIDRAGCIQHEACFLAKLRPARP